MSIKSIFSQIWERNIERKKGKINVIIDNEETEKGFICSKELRSFAFRGTASDFGDNFPYYAEVKFQESKD